MVKPFYYYLVQAPVMKRNSALSPSARGVGTRGGGTGARAKSALFVMKIALFVQTNVALNTNLTLKLHFVSQTYLRIPFDTS